MNFKKLTSLALGALLATGAAFADGPFREHRYSSFKATPADNIDVMFVGNSITHMHEWWEAFGSQQGIAGRGNSGGLSSEVLANLESYIDGKPKKLFLMIGTNDITTSGSIAKGDETVMNIRMTLERIQLESPETEIYMQSILPRKNQNATLAYCNNKLSELCVELGVNYVDLTETMKNIANDSHWANDGLHPQTIGYSAWTHFIEPQVGYSSVYPDPSEIKEYKYGDLKGSHASRVAQFPYLPINEGDILIFGDELVHGGEWHELLGSPKVKDRGTGWGTGGINLNPQGQTVIKNTLENRTVKPAAIIINYGEGGKDANNYRLLIDEAKKHAPDAKIFCMNLPPRTAEDNADTANKNFNNNVVKVAAEEKGVGYIDIYTSLAANRSKYIMNNSYITGAGYAIIAQEIAKALADFDLNPVSEATGDALIARRDIRTIVGNKISEAIKFRESLDAELRPEIQKAIVEAAGKISNTMTRAQANAAAEKLQDAMYKVAGTLLPNPSTDAETHWYVVRSVRGNRVMTADNGQLKGFVTTPNPKYTTGHDIWKLLEREDGTYDFVNMHGEYINADGTKNNDVVKVTAEKPVGGWDFAPSHYETGSFVIFSDEANKAQLNQANNGAYAVLNWHPDNNYPILTDEGSSFTFEEYFGEQIEHMASGWYRMSIETVKAGESLPSVGKHVINADAEYRQNASNYYALIYGPEQTEFPAKEFIHLTVDGSKHAFTALNGHGVKENCTSDRQSVSDDNPSLTLHDNGFYSVGKWNTYDVNGKTYVGKSSSSDNTFSLTPVDEETLQAYDIWKVEITAADHSEVGLDVRVTLDNPENKGISTVFNGGSYFLTAGTEITRVQLTFTASNPQELDEPFVHINPDNHVIQIDYTDPNPDVPVSSIELPYESLEMTVGDTKTIEVTINPSDATEQTVVWTSSNSLVVSVDENGSLTALAAGTAIITAACGEEHTAELTVTVVEPQTVPEPEPALTIDQTKLELVVGESKTLLATVENPLATDEAVTWQSDNEAVATVSSDGLVTAVSAGNATVTASYAGLTATCEVTVTEKEEDGIFEISISSDTKVYDLQGRRVKNPKSGLYIIDNRKVCL